MDLTIFGIRGTFQGWVDSTYTHTSGTLSPTSFAPNSSGTSVLNISFSDADRSKYAAQFSSVTISMWGTVATTGSQSTGNYMELWLYITLTSGSLMSDYAQARQTNQTDTAQLSWTGTVTGLSRVWATAGCYGNKWGNITGSSVSIVFNK